MVIYEPNRVIKAHVLVDFVIELTKIDHEKLSEELDEWVFYTNGSLKKSRSGVKVILERQGGLIVESTLKFDFWATNNQDDYKVVITRLKLVKEFGVAITITKNYS